MKEFKCRKCGCKNYRKTKWKMKVGKKITKRFAEPSRRLSESVVCRDCNQRQRR